MIYLSRAEFFVSDVLMRLNRETGKIDFTIEFTGELPFGNEEPIEIKKIKTFSVDQSSFLKYENIQELIRLAMEKLHGMVIVS